MTLPLKERYASVRKKTLDIVAPLETEDFCVQPIPQVSPPKWHLAHTTWFFEKLVLEKHTPGYQPQRPEYDHIFNSYYKSLGTHSLSGERGHFSRPTVKEIRKYREETDQKIGEILEKNISDELQSLLVLGLNHEQQHQELLLMDIKNIFFHQQGDLAYAKKIATRPRAVLAKSLREFEGGFFEVGENHSFERFTYDNEGPKHRIWLPPFKISNRLVSNHEYLEFLQAGGYENPEYWLSDGWNWVSENKIQAPLYWLSQENSWFAFGFHGWEPLQLEHPVLHLSYYEAQAFARYKNLRLPTEFEWEFMAKKTETVGPSRNFLNPRQLEAGISSHDFEDLHGSLWQWTQSGYLPYPGHAWSKGPLGEYNAKFMVNQMTLRGGSFATERDHYRLTYRNFFNPADRWAFTGLRLAGDP